LSQRKLKVIEILKYQENPTEQKTNAYYLLHQTWIPLNLKKKGETTQDTNKINRSDEEIGQEKPAVNGKPKGRTVFKQKDKIMCPICQTEWTGQISTVGFS
jgi:hypothetical protein